MNNENRRRIINKAKAEGYQGSYVDLFKQAAQDPTLIAQTPEEKQAGLRPQHEAGRTDASMAFTDVPPNTPFNTVGMKAPIDIKKYDEQGHLVKSYENVPPGLTNIDSGPRNGTVLESPARMQEGGLKPMTSKTFPSNAERAKNINYAKQIDMAGRLNAIGANTTNEELGLGAADRGKLPLVPNPQMEAAMSNKRIKAQEGDFVTAGPTVPDFVATGPKVRINREEYQSTKGTGATRTAMQRTPDGEMAPSVLLPSAEVYDSAINRIPEDYSPETKALAEEGARGVAERRGQAVNIGLAAAGDFFTTAQRYGVSAPLALARGKTPNLSGTPLLDRAVGAESPNAFPSEILGIQNPYGAIATDILTDPMSAFALTTLGKQGLKAGRNYAALRRFKSEVDWAKWNPDTPNHPSLMDEYKQIEFQTKKSGTWMKNADGSAYKGSPEQFIQENSSHFKKAYPLGANRLYHGTWNKYTPRVEPTAPNKLDFTFTADEGLARNYMDLYSDAHKWSIPLSTPQNIATPVAGREVAAFNLLQPKSRNKYSIISQGDDWGDVVIGGRAKEDLPGSVAFQKTQAAAHRAKIAGGDDSIVRKNLVTRAENTADRYQYWHDWYDKLVHRTPSKAPNFEAALKSNDQATSLAGGKTGLVTDKIGEETVKEGLDYTILYGLNDGGMSKYVNIHNARPGNYLKSRIGNVGFFDMNNPDVFKGLAPLGVGAGLMNKRQEGGFAQKRRSAQKGSVVDYLLPALESNNPTQFADTQLSNQTENIKIQQDNLRAEEQRVQDVRNNVIPTAQNLAALNKDIKDAGYFSDYSPHKKHFNKMRDPDTSPKEYKQLEKEAQEKYPELIEAIPENNVMMMNNQKYDADDELYCTPYGCYTYKKAGAKDVPEYSGNFGFVGGANKGENPFQKISADKAVSGDVGIMYEHVVNDYRDESKGMSLRPHHTAILSEKTDDPQLIKAYSAVNGERLNFMEGMLKAEDIKDKAGNTKEGRWDYYRYIGQTPRMQRNLSDSKHNQKQADLVSKALQKQAELSANMPKTENISMIDRRRASKIESENNSQDIVKSFGTIPEVKKSNKQKVEQAANSVKGKIETAKQRKARVNAVRKKARAQTKAVRKGQ